VPGRATGALALVLALAAVGSRSARADDEDLPRGSLGLAFAFRRNLAPLEERYGLGYLAGVVGGYQITRPGDLVTVGVIWSTLLGRSRFLFGWFRDDADDIATGPLKYLEVSLGLKVRYRLTELWPVFLGLTGGGTLLRTHVPVPPTDDRRNLGGFAGACVETYVLGNVLVDLEARYGLLGDGPRGVELILSASLGR
jgi:hypothetical protein